VLHGVDRGAAWLGGLLSKRVGLADAGIERVFVVPDRDRDRLAGVAVDHEIGVRETVDLFERIGDALEPLDRLIGVAAVVGADTSVH